jgi:hypothetical protein
MSTTYLRPNAQNRDVTLNADRLGASFGRNTTNPINFDQPVGTFSPQDGRSYNPPVEATWTNPYRDGVGKVPMAVATPTIYNRSLEPGWHSSPVTPNLTQLGHIGGYSVGDPRSPIHRIDASMASTSQAGTNTGFQSSGGTGRNQPPPSSTPATAPAS